LHLVAFGFEGVDPQIQASAFVETFHQRPEFVAQLVFERLHQPVRQVVPMAFHQVCGLYLFALVEPIDLLLGQGAAQKITRAIKAQNRQTALFRATARGSEVVKQQLLAQHVVRRLGHGGAFTRTKTTVITEKPRHDGISGMVKFKGQTHQFGTGVKQGFWMHSLRLSHGHRFLLPAQDPVFPAAATLQTFTRRCPGSHEVAGQSRGSGLWPQCAKPARHPGASAL